MLGRMHNNGIIYQVFVNIYRQDSDPLVKSIVEITLDPPIHIRKRLDNSIITLGI